MAPIAGFAQNTRLEALLENQLSGDGRVVEIDGFTGALSAQAQMAALRIFDSQGLWIELTGLTLDWNRAALLRGRLDVNELSAAEIRVLRQPQSEGASVPDAQASGFRIPDLPVAIAIGRLAIADIVLEPPVLGQRVEATAEMRATLADGALDLSLIAQRVDATRGEARIDLSFDPEMEALAVDFDVSEPQGGIVATALSLPGAPDLSLKLVGAGPLDAFEATFELATEGAPRFDGTATLTAVEDGARAFDLALDGDIRPLLEPGSRGFFGAETVLTAEGLAGQDGRLTLDALRLEAAQLLLEGSAALDGGAPQRIELSGALRDPERVVLPAGDVTLAGAELAIAFDAAVSDAWDLRLTARDVAAGDVALDILALEGRGTLLPGFDTPFSGRIALEAGGIAFADAPELEAAVGPDAWVETEVTLGADGRVGLRELTAQTATLRATGRADVTPVEGRLALAADLSTEVPALGPFSGLAGRDLAGRASADVQAEAELPGGAISVALDARTEAIDIGVEALAALLTPVSELSLAARRDEGGSQIERFELSNPELTVTVDGDVSAEDGALAVAARLREIGLFTEAVSGAVTLDVALTDALGAGQIVGDLSTAFGLRAEVEGALSGPDAGVTLDGVLEEIERFVPQLNGPAALVTTVDLAGEVPRLDAELTAAPGVAARVEGALSGPGQALDISAEIADLGAFAAPLPGPARLVARVSDFESGPMVDARLTASPGLSVELSGRPTQPGATLTLTAAAQDLAFLAPQLAGPAQVDAALTDLLGEPNVTADIAASPGIAAQISGQPLAAAGAVTLRGQVADLGVLVPQLAGALEVTARLEEPLGAQRLTAQAESAAGIRVDASGRLAAPNDGLSLTARIDQLGRFVAGLTGGADITADAEDLFGAPRLDVRLATDSGATATAEGQVGLPDGAVQMRAAGSVPLSVADAFAGNRSLEGNAVFDLALSGAPDLSNLTGTITTRDARVFDPAAGLTFSPIDADITLSDGRTAVEGRASLGGVPIRLEGAGGLTSPYPLDLSLNTTRLPVTYTDLFESELSAEITVTGSAEQRLVVAGDVRIEDVEIRIPDTGLGGATDIPPIRHQGAPQEVRRTIRRAGLSLSGESETQDQTGAVIPLDLMITAITPIFVRGRGIDAGFEGSLRVTGTAADPEPIGEFALTRGRLDFLGRRLDLDEGRITVAGSLLPEIDISSSAQVDDVTAEISLVGPVDQPELVLTSTPELPEDEILARVLFGQGIETLSAFQVARLVNSLRKLSGAAGAGVVEGTRRGLGVDNLDVRTNAETGEAELAIGQALDDDVYTEVEIDSEGTTTINLNLDLNETTTLRGSAGSDGTTGFGIFWQRDY